MGSSSSSHSSSAPHSNRNQRTDFFDGRLRVTRGGIMDECPVHLHVQQLGVPPAWRSLGLTARSEIPRSRPKEAAPMRGARALLGRGREHAQFICLLPALSATCSDDLLRAHDVRVSRGEAKVEASALAATLRLHDPDLFHADLSSTSIRLEWIPDDRDCTHRPTESTSATRSRPRPAR